MHFHSQVYIAALRLDMSGLASLSAQNLHAAAELAIADPDWDGEGGGGSSSVDFATVLGNVYSRTAEDDAKIRHSLPAVIVAERDKDALWRSIRPVLTRYACLSLEVADDLRWAARHSVLWDMAQFCHHLEQCEADRARLMREYEHGKCCEHDGVWVEDPASGVNAESE